MDINIYIYLFVYDICSWNPNGAPCFDWSFFSLLFAGFFHPKIEDKQYRFQLCCLSHPVEKILIKLDHFFPILQVNIKTSVKPAPRLTAFFDCQEWIFYDFFVCKLQYRNTSIFPTHVCWWFSHSKQLSKISKSNDHDDLIPNDMINCTSLRTCSNIGICGKKQKISLDPKTMKRVFFKPP